MLTSAELRSLARANELEAERTRLYDQSDALQAASYHRVSKAIQALPLGGSFARPEVQSIVKAVEQFPQGFYRSELRTSLNMKGPWTK